jgi:hypothetical protein
VAEFREGMTCDLVIKGVRINRLHAEGRGRLPVAQIHIPGPEATGDGYYTIIPLGWDAIEFHVSEPADGGLDDA